MSIFFLIDFRREIRNTRQMSFSDPGVINGNLRKCLLFMVLAASYPLSNLPAAPRPPFPPAPEVAPLLYYNGFDDAYWSGYRTEDSVTNGDEIFVADWSGY